MPPLREEIAAKYADMFSLDVTQDDLGGLK